MLRCWRNRQRVLSGAAWLSHHTLLIKIVSPRLLQSALRGVIKGVGGFDHAEWRAFRSERTTAEAKGFVDGDLIEQVTTDCCGCNLSASWNRCSEWLHVQTPQLHLLHSCLGWSRTSRIPVRSGKGCNCCHFACVPSP